MNIMATFFDEKVYFWFSHDATVAMLVPLNKETTVMLVSQTNPQGIEFYSYARLLSCFG